MINRAKFHEPSHKKRLTNAAMIDKFNELFPQFVDDIGTYTFPSAGVCILRSVSTGKYYTFIVWGDNEWELKLM